MLTSPTTRFPVYIDPSFTTITGTGGEQAYDPVQSGSGCTGSHYDSSSCTASPVGYDNFQAGSCQDNDTDYALYRAAILAAIDRLLDGAPQQSEGRLSVSQLAAEAGVKRWHLTHQHTDLKDLLSPAHGQPGRRSWRTRRIA